MDNTLAQKIVDYTNNRINRWYEEVKRSYGVNGKGICEFDSKENNFIIKFIEDDKKYKKVIHFYEEYAFANISIIFDIWSEQGHIDSEIPEELV